MNFGQPPQGGFPPPPAGGGGGFPPPAPGPDPLGDFGGSALDIRDPLLPLGFVGIVDLLETAERNTHRSGHGIYITVKAVHIASPGGGEHPGPLPKNVNLQPAAPEGRYVIALRGFDKTNRKKMAYADLLSFLVSTLGHKGVTRANVEQMLTPEHKTRLAQAVRTGQYLAQLEGHTQFAVQTFNHVAESGHALQKYNFRQLQEIGAPSTP